MGTRRRQVVVLVACAVALTVGVGLAFGRGLLDLLFLAVLLVPLVLALRHAVMAAAQARRADGEARRLAAADRTHVVADAVSLERLRLSADIHASVTAAVAAMREGAQRAAEQWESDPRPALEGIAQRGRDAMTDLRLLLGLLRDGALPAPSTPPAVPPPRRRVRRADVVLAALSMLDALLWSVLSGSVPGALVVTPLGTVLTCLVAGTVVARTVAPGAGAVVAAGLVAAATTTGHPVGGGLWLAVTVGGLAWSCAARERDPVWAVVGPLALGAAFVHKHASYAPENLQITLTILGAGLVTGGLVRLGRRRAAAARSATRAVRAELDAAADEALRAERRTVARDLHDAVSGGIGVIVMQAGAAQALRRSDEARARRALGIVVDMCSHTLEELERLLVELQRSGAGGGGSESRHVGDVQALVDRMRAAGLRIDAAVDHDGAGDALCWTVTYRVVQESLTNVLRHAPAAAVRLRIAADEAGEHLCVDVVDDGPGPATSSLRGYGLVGLTERVHGAGGSLTVGSAPAGGFGVHARIPTLAADHVAPGAGVPPVVDRE